MATNGTAPTTGDLLEVPSGVARLRYFYGQLLTQRDLSAEQGYHLMLRRLMQREGFGTGTVSGLKVDPTGAGAPDCVTVRAGLALDPDGRELLLVRDVSVKVADAVLPSSTVSYIPGPFAASDIAPLVVTAWGASFDESDVGYLATHLFNAGLIAAEAGPFPLTAAQLNLLTPPEPAAAVVLAPGQLLRDYLFDQIVGTTYLGLRYVERGKEPSPAVLDGSCCGDVSCFPARLEEGVVIVAQSTPLPAIVDTFALAKEAVELNLLAQEVATTSTYHDAEEALCECVIGPFRGLPPNDEPCGPATPPVVPLARVYWSRFLGASGQSRVLSIDNCTFRPLAPGVPPIRALVEVLTRNGSPPAIQPRFDQIDPVNRGPITVSGTTATASARSTSTLGSILTTTWEVDFYPASPGPVMHWNQGSLPAMSYGFTINVYPPTVVAGRTYVQLKFESLSSSPLTLPSGTYVWRLNVDFSIAGPFGAILDGLPRPPDVVPTGDDNPTTQAAFQAVFYVP